MHRALLLILLLAFSSILSAVELPSPVDIKYKNKNPALYARFDEARSLLDGWRGQQEILSKAYQILSEITTSDRDYAPAYREFGRLYIMAGYINRDNFEPGGLRRSESVILKSIQIEPNYADAYVLLGHLYTQMGRYDEAKAALEKGEKIGTVSPWLHLNWADLLREQGDEQKALQRYLEVINAGTENKKAFGTAIEGVIRYFEGVGQYDKADDWYKKQLAYEPSNAWAWGNYASFLLFSRGDAENAIKNAETAISIMDYGMGRFILACALYTKWTAALKNNSKIEAAQALFDRAYKLYPDIDSVIDETMKHASTKETATKLAEHKRRFLTKPALRNG